MAAAPRPTGHAAGSSPEPTPLAHAERAETRAVEEETVALLYRQSLPAVFFSVAAASILALTLLDAANRGRLALWYAAVLAMGCLRLALFQAYAHRAPQGAAVLAWRRPYLWSLGLAASVWGAGGLWITPNDSVLHQAVVYLFVVGMAGSALATYAAVRTAAMSAFLPMLLPLTVWLLSAGGRVQVGMGVGGLLFLAGATRAMGVLSATQNRNIVLRLKLDEARQRAEAAARTDPLTGLDNRRAFTERGAAAVDYCHRHGLPVALLLIDIDRFKAVNDQHGHAAGDEVLRHLGALLQDSLRGSDVAGRLGGEEFAVVLPHTAGPEALRVAEKLRAAVAAASMEHGTARFACTVSIGVAAGSGTLEALLRRADAAMYRAKLAGRDRVEREPESDSGA